MNGRYDQTSNVNGSAGDRIRVAIAHLVAIVLVAIVLVAIALVVLVHWSLSDRSLAMPVTALVVLALFAKGESVAKPALFVRTKPHMPDILDGAKRTWLCAGSRHMKTNLQSQP